MQTINKLVPPSSLQLYFRFAVRPSDLSAIRRLVETAGVFSPSEVAVAVELAEERLARGVESGYHFIFAEEGERLVGYACYGPVPLTVASFDLYWIAVEKALQGQRVGRELLRRVEEHILQLGGRRVYIETSGRPCYAHARKFYLRCGYHQAAVLKDFYAPGDDKVIYARVLEAEPAAVNVVSHIAEASLPQSKLSPTVPRPR